VLTTSATAAIFGHIIWDVVDLVKQLPSLPLVVLCLLAVILATMSVNVPANLVSASYDISNLAPRKISMWRGAQITAVIGTIMLPWRLMATASDYVFLWLGTIGIVLGPVAGIMIADYWWVRRCKLSVPDLYNANGIYRYLGGVNPKAVFALALGILGAYSGSLNPSLKIFSDLNWVTGFLVSMLSYAFLMGRIEG
jgi:NCS1 family nucleobase:cation symporter-1